MSENESEDLKPTFNPDLKIEKPLRTILNMAQKAGVIEFTEPKGLEEEIREWVNHKYRQSKNKDEYVKAFKYAYLLPNARDMNSIDIARKIHRELEIKLSERTLRQEVKKFLFKFKYKG